MQELPLERAFTLIEPGPVVLLATSDGERDNVMVVTWTMVLGFDARFAICTGAWNHSWKALTRTRECVLAIPPADMIDTVIGIGTCSGAEVDKFSRFPLTREEARHDGAPLIAECLANIECRVIEVIARQDIVVLQGLAAWQDVRRADAPMLHAVGDGTFITDGGRLDRREAMRAKLPDGV